MLQVPELLPVVPQVVPRVRRTITKSTHGPGTELADSLYRVSTSSHGVCRGFGEHFSHVLHKWQGIQLLADRSDSFSQTFSERREPSSQIRENVTKSVRLSSCSTRPHSRDQEKVTWLFILSTSTIEFGELLDESSVCTNKHNKVRRSQGTR